MGKKKGRRTGKIQWLYYKEETPIDKIYKTHTNSLLIMEHKLISC